MVKKPQCLRLQRSFQGLYSNEEREEEESKWELVWYLPVL
jgi:hypothetical protein